MSEKVLENQSLMWNDCKVIADVIGYKAESVYKILSGRRENTKVVKAYKKYEALKQKHQSEIVAVIKKAIQ